MHSVASNWREADALALETRVLSIEEALTHIEDLMGMYDDEEIAAELRSMAARLRTERNDFSSAAERLRAELIDQK